MSQFRSLRRRWRTAWRVAVIAGATTLALSGAVASAQNIGQTTGQIEGIVIDATGLVLPGVAVTVTSPALVGSRTTVTDSAGAYRFPGLPPGLYKVEASLQGFITVAVENIDVRAGQILKPNIKMAPGVTSEVTVVASPTLDVLSSAVSNNLRADVIDELPKGRSWESVVQLAPSVNQEATQGDKGISFRGASISENSYIVDGVDTTAVVVGTAGQEVVLEFIDEVQVKSGFVGADYGGALGGIVNVVTKSGSNAFKGLLNVQFSGDALTADPRQTLRVVPTNSKAAEYITYPEDGLAQIDFGGTAGGRIVQDRLWFFVGVMPQFSDTERQAPLSDGSSGTFTSEVRRSFFTGKLTGRPFNDLTFNLTTSISPDNTSGSLPNQDGTSPSNADYAARGRKSGKIASALSADWILSAKVFINAFAGYHTKKTHDVGVPEADRYRYALSNIGMPGVPVDFQHPILWETSPDTTNVYNNDDTRLSFGTTATFFFNAGGRHLLKGGFQYARPTTYLNYGPTQERVDVHWNASSFGQRGTYGYWRAFDISSDGRVVSNNQAVFVQDTWSLSRFTLNLGLRTEREDLTPYVNTGAAARNIKFGFGDKLAPRFGITWDVRGNSSWKVYANAGMFYDMMKHSAPRDGFGGGVFKISYYTLDTYDYTQLTKKNPIGRFISALDLRGAGDTLDPAIKPSKTNVYDFGTEFELAKNLTIGIGFVHRALDNVVEDFYVQTGTTTTGAPIYQKVFGNPARGLVTQPYGPNYPAQPKFERTYDGIDFQLHKRFSNNWTANASYTFSRLKGNFDGLADPDQQNFPDINPNLGIFCDYLEGCYTAGGTLDSGRLAADRPHQFKLNGSYTTRWGLTIGGFFQALSGTPVTRMLGVNSQTVGHPEGRGSDGRNPFLTQTDLSLMYELSLGGNRRLSLLANVLNLFNQDTSTRKSQNMLLGQSVTIKVPVSTYFAGYDYEAAITASGSPRDPRFLMADRFQPPRAIRLGARFEF